VSGPLLELASQFVVLSLLSFGGAAATLPDIHRQVVDVHHWLTAAEFTQMFALSQAAPGPNVLVVALIGWKVAGIVGGVVAMLAMCGPSSVLAYWVGVARDRFRASPVRAAIERGLAPITVGMIVASGVVLMRTTDHNVAGYALTLATTLVLVLTRVHPLVMLAAGAIIGIAGFV
jgi:chromate transporter